MTRKNRGENIHLELELGNQARAEAEVLLEKKLVKGAVSRTYYFVLHYTKALLYSLGLEAKSHEGVGHPLNLHFIKSGKFPPRYGKLFSRLQKYREQADYDPALVFTLQDAMEEFREGKEFSLMIRAYLQRQGYLGKK